MPVCFHVHGFTLLWECICICTLCVQCLWVCALCVCVSLRLIAGIFLSFFLAFVLRQNISLEPRAVITHPLHLCRYWGLKLCYPYLHTSTFITEYLPCLGCYYFQLLLRTCLFLGPGNAFCLAMGNRCHLPLSPFLGFCWTFSLFWGDKKSVLCKHCLWCFYW